MSECEYIKPNQPNTTNDHPLSVCVTITDPAALAYIYRKLDRESEDDWNIADVIEDALAFCLQGK